MDLGELGCVATNLLVHPVKVAQMVTYLSGGVLGGMVLIRTSSAKGSITYRLSTKFHSA